MSGLSLFGSGLTITEAQGPTYYLGTWDASTNTPTLVSSTAPAGPGGSYYIVSVAGTTNLNGITDWTVGDWVIWSGSVWQKLEGGMTSVTVGSTQIAGGTSGRVLYDNAGVLGEMTNTGTGTVNVLQTSPALITPALGIATGTSLALGGATLGVSDALAVTGNVKVSGSLYVGTGGGSLFFYNASRIDDTGGSGLFRLLNAATTGIVLNVSTSNVLAVRTSNNGADGAITASSGTFSGNITIPNGGTLQSVSQGQVSFSGADAQWLFRNGGGTTGFTLDWATDNVVKLLSRAGAATTILDFGTGSNAGIRWGTSSLGLFNNSNNVLAVRSAANNSDASITAAAGTFSSYVQASGTFLWNSAGRITAQSDGVVTLLDAATTSFGRLQFGGTGATYPAIARSGTTLKFRTADDLNDAPITASSGTFSTSVTWVSGSLDNTSGGQITMGGNTRLRAQSSGTLLISDVISGYQATLSVSTVNGSFGITGAGNYFYSNNAAFVASSKTTLTNGAAAQVGTLTNAPAAGNPTKWIGIDDNGTTRYIPAW